MLPPLGSNRSWPYNFSRRATDPRSPYTDDDLFDDGYESLYGMDPRKADNETADSDGDGLSDFEEQIWRTCPSHRDTDGDGYSDRDEIQSGTDPLDDTDYPGSDDNRTIPITLTVGDPSTSESER